MKRNLIKLGIAMAVVVALGLVAGCGQQQPPATATPAVDLAVEEKAIRAAAAEWYAAIQAKDLEKTLSFYAADACIFPPGSPRVSDAAGRRKVFEGLFSQPGVEFKVETTDVTVSHHGDMAYEAGKVWETGTDKRGKKTTKEAKFVVVWRKQTDGQWKAVADIFNYDQ